ncbi:PASTA domain-containing protein [Arthrobacter sp. RHLT1-20]
MLAGLMLTGCGGKQAAAQPTTAATSAVAVVADAIAVPGVISLTLDKATDKLTGLGLKVKATDTKDDKLIIDKSNWQVISQDPAEGAQVAKGSTVKLGVKHLTDATPTPTPTPSAAVVVPAQVVAPVAPAPAPAPFVPPAPAPAPVPEAPKPFAGIVCNDGYAWPGTTRQGACRGHGGIRN